MDVNRRTFCAAAVPLLATAADWQFFTLEDAALVDAICDCIVPADEHPGARQAGVVRYIDRQLKGPLARFANTYHTGLPKLQQACLKATGSHFADLSFDQRTAFLAQVEKSDLAGFFNMLIDHTMQGFYGSPSHGGNRDEASWKMLGIDRFMREGEHHHG